MERAASYFSCRFPATRTNHGTNRSHSGVLRRGGALQCALSRRHSSSHTAQIARDRSRTNSNRGPQNCRRHRTGQSSKRERTRRHGSRRPKHCNRKTSAKKPARNEKIPQPPSHRYHGHDRSRTRDPRAFLRNPSIRNSNRPRNVHDDRDHTRSKATRAGSQSNLNRGTISLEILSGDLP